MTFNKSNVIVSGSRSSLSEYANYTTVYPKPAMVGGKIVLTQDMINKQNVKYIIKWNFDLDDETITVPEGCLIEFDGGSFSNGTLVGTETILVYNQEEEDVFKNVSLEGSFERSTSAIADKMDNTNGMAKIYLKKNKPLATQLTQPNTIYVIQYDFTLGEDITVPEGCILEFDGGNIGGAYTITLNSTLLQGNVLFKRDTIVDGSVANNVLYSDWFDCYKNGVGDDAPQLRNAVRLIYNRHFGTLHLNKGTYYLNSGDPDTDGWLTSGYSIFKLPDNFCIEGEGESSVLYYNVDRLGLNSHGDAMTGSIFTNEYNSVPNIVNGDIVFKNLKVLYSTPNKQLQGDHDYIDGQFVCIYFGHADFVSDYHDVNVKINNVIIKNAVGHQAIRCDKVRYFESANNIHNKAGLDTDAKNRDYSVYYVNSETFIAHDNIIDCSGTIFETHSEFVDIYSNVFINSGICCIPVGGMTDNIGNLRPAIIRIHDNIVKNTRYFIAPYYYSNTKIQQIECCNNNIGFKNERSIPRYLFPSTDTASIDTNYLDIENIYIHHEIIEQKSVSEISIWNRFFRTTNIKNLVITDCVFRELSNYPLLVYDNNGHRSIKNVVFSNNVFENCGKDINFSTDNATNRSIVVFNLRPDANYDETDINITIEDNNFKDVNNKTLLLFKSIANIGTESSPIDINLNVNIKGNNIQSVMPISKSVYNAYVNWVGIEHINVDVYDFSESSIAIFLTQNICNTDIIKKGTKVTFNYSDGASYEVLAIADNFFTIRGIDKIPFKSIGWTPKGAIINIKDCWGKSYICAQAGTTPVWVPNSYNTLDIIDVPSLPEDMRGYSALSGTNIPVWWKNNVWLEADGAKAAVRRSGTFAQKPAAADIYVGFKYFCTNRQTTEGATDGIEIIHKGNNVWVDALGRVVS